MEKGEEREKRRERKREITVDFKISQENLAEKKKGGKTSLRLSLLESDHVIFLPIGPSSYARSLKILLFRVHYKLSPYNYFFNPLITTSNFFFT